MIVFLKDNKKKTHQYPKGIEEVIVLVDEKKYFHKTRVLVTKKRIEIFHKGTVVKLEI